MSRTGFHLSKCYVDCVGDAGECAIAYHARLRWGPIALGYAGLLARGPADGTWSVSTFHPGGAPVATMGHVDWRTPALDLGVAARSRCPPFERRLLQRGEQCIHWECLAPCADVRVRCGSALTLSGLGYAERLEVDLPSWRLPIHQLRWGRFLTPTRAIVWIGWWGPEPRTLVFDDGLCQTEPVIEDGEVRFGRSRLALDREAVVRDIDLDEIVRPPACRRALRLARAARIHETKWLSRGRLCEPGQSGLIEGWAIHELVLFP